MNIPENELPNVAPRITAADIEANIVSEYYFTAADGVYGHACYDEEPEVHVGNVIVFVPEPLEQITFCTLILKNGHKIVGINEGPVSAANFDPLIGKRLARTAAVDQIWPLMGYELRTKLAA